MLHKTDIPIVQIPSAALWTYPQKLPESAALVPEIVATAYIPKFPNPGSFFLPVK